MPAFIYLNGQGLHLDRVDRLETAVPGGSIFKLMRDEREEVVVGFVHLGPGCLATFGEAGEDVTTYMPVEQPLR
jgi:hypothetical protein